MSSPTAAGDVPKNGKEQRHARGSSRTNTTTSDASATTIPDLTFQLPVSRVRTIMRSSPDVDNIAQDALHAVTLAAELFIKDITTKVYHTNADRPTIEYDDVAALVATSQEFEFLEEIAPKKLKGHEILKMKQVSKEKSSS